MGTKLLHTVFFGGGELLSVTIMILLTGTKSPPDPNTFEKSRDTPPISIATLLQKLCPLLGRK